MTDSIVNQTPEGTSFPDVPPVNSAVANPAKSPLQSSSRNIRAAWQWALWAARQKNIAAQSNNGQRVPLAQ